MEVERIFSEYDTFVTPVEVEDMISATFRCNNGAIGNIEAGSCVKGGEFAKTVFSGKKLPITGKDGRKSLEIVLAAYASADQEKTIEIN